MRALKHTVLLAAVCCACALHAQQEWQYSQYMFNLYDANGAFAGAYEQASFAARFRTQWIGVDGAPVSQTLSAHLPAGPVGVGARLQHERLGARSRVLVKATVAYPMRLGNGRLALALNGGIVREQWRTAELSAKHPDETLLALDTPTATLPSIDFAAFYHTRAVFAGMEVSHLNAGSAEPTTGTTYGLWRQAQAVVGTAIGINAQQALRPSAMVRWSAAGIITGEVDVAWLWEDRLWLGAGYRLDFGLVGYAEYLITNTLRIGYAYDYATGPLSQFQTGSHEVLIGWNLAPKSPQNQSIRYFR